MAYSTPSKIINIINYYSDSENKFSMVLKESILRLLHKSPRNHKKICVLINLDNAIIASIFFSENAMQNDIVHELGFTIISALELLGLQL